MSATLEWDVPFTLTTSQGTLLINQYEPTIDGFYILDHSNCSSARALRLTRDVVPQASGEIPHPRFTDGYEMHLKIELWKDPEGNKPAWHLDRVYMNDFLMLHMNALLDGVQGRIQWTPGFGDPSMPAGLDDRMLDKILLLDWPGAADEDVVTSVLASFVTPYPYVMRAAETTTNLPEGVTTTVTNPGSSMFWPVFKVYGPCSAFTLVNASVFDEDGNPLQINYDSGLPGAIAIPGGGQYAEITTFENKVYLNGNGANLKPGLDINTSDFFPLIPGDNDISISLASADMLWNYSYA